VTTKTIGLLIVAGLALVTLLGAAGLLVGGAAVGY